MKQVGIVGWRGMVGSVLLQRMIEENDFDDISAHFFSTSSAGAAGPVIKGKSDKLKDANSLREGANKQVISSQADSLIKISRIWADFFPANTSNQPI
ncbi:hypothetical protein SL62_01816 [Klebsiella pneumoniae]|nr:hypothetical protein SL62_01816 [Klebsiella pneumoniae]